MLTGDAAGPFTTLHVTNAYHARSGGVRTFYHALLTAAERLGRRMHLVVPGDRTHTECAGSFGRIHHVAAAPAPWIDTRYRLLRPAAYLTRSSPIGQLLRGIRPDIVEVCDKHSLVPMARLLRWGWHAGEARPTVIGASAERFDDAVRTHVTAARVGARLAKRYIRSVYVPTFDALVANSPYTAAELADGGSTRPVHICSPGVANELFAGAAPDAGLREQLLTHAGGTRDSLLMLYAGRLAREKHLDVLIDALDVLRRDGHARDARLVLVGDGPDRDRLVARAAAAVGSGLLVVDHVHSPRALATYLATADVFVHPNPHEPFGIGPLEAMATGTPVVVSDRGGVRSYANHDNAWLSAPEPAALAAAIRRAAAGPDRVRLAAARRTAAAFDWPVVAERYFARLDDAHRHRLQAEAAEGSCSGSLATGQPSAQWPPEAGTQSEVWHVAGGWWHR